VPLELAGLTFPSLISIRVPLEKAGDCAAAMSELFRRKPGETSVRLRLESARDFSLLLDVAEKVRPDREFQAEVARLCGAEAYEVLAR
jgi:DNA polymerase-3 subunit alpha